MTQIIHWSSAKYNAYFKGLLGGFKEIMYTKHRAQGLAHGKCSKSFTVIIIIMITIITIIHYYPPQFFNYFPKLLLIFYLDSISLAVSHKRIRYMKVFAKECAL